MPYNFEATFTQPLLKDLDNGVLGDSRDWARAVTRYYIDTIKTGLPQQVPVTLPAPGLGTPPPPFPIGASPYLTANAQYNKMYNIVYNYFRTKEKVLDFDSFQQLVVDIRRLIFKIRTKTREIKAYIEQAKLIKEQLAQLPQIIEDLIVDLQEEVQSYKDQINEIGFDINKLKTEIDPEQFNSLFERELELYDKVANFKVDSVASVRELSLLLSEYGQRTNNVLNVVGENRASLYRAYLRDKLLGIAKIYLGLAEGVTDPTKIIDLISRFRRDKERAERILRRIGQFDLFVRYLKPKLRKLQKQIKQRKDELRTKYQKKLEKAKEDYRKKQEERAKRKKAKKKELSVEEKKVRADRKKKFKRFIKKARKKIQLTYQAYNLTIQITGKSTSLYEGAKLEFETIKTEIQEYQAKLAELQTTFTATNVSNVVQTNIQTTATQQANQYQQNFNQYQQALNQYQSQSLTQYEQQLQSYQTNLGVLNIIESSIGLGQVFRTDATYIQGEVVKLRDYFGVLDLREFANLAARILVDLRCDFQTFKNFFLRKKDLIVQYARELKGLVEDVLNLQKVIFQLLGTDKLVPKPIKRALGWIVNRVKRLPDLVRNIGKWVRNRIKAIGTWLKRKRDDIKNKIKKTVSKFKRALRRTYDKIVKPNSQKEDPETRAREKEEKKKRMLERKKKIANFIKLSGYSVKLARAGLRLSNNFIKGNLKLSDNETYIQDILTSLYAFKMHRQNNTVVAQLMKQKNRDSDRLKSLVIIEALSYSLIEFFKEAQQTEFSKELSDYINLGGLEEQAKNNFNSIKNLMDNPPTTLPALKDTLNVLTLDIVNTKIVATKILELEQKYLNYARETVKTILSIPSLKQDAKFRRQVVKIQRVLNSKTSFILWALDYLKKLIKNLFAFIKRITKKFVQKIKKWLRKQREKLKKDHQKSLNTQKEKFINGQAAAMSIALGLATRNFWTGAKWVGATGSDHTCLTIGSFKRIKAKPADGATAIVREMAKSFERQLDKMRGIIVPPAPTGLSPLRFSGYK